MNTMQNPKGGLHTPLQQLLLLEERVRQAGATLPDAARDAAFHGIKCVINGRNCVILLREVAEVIDSRPVTAVPGAAAWLEGVINYRGALVPVWRLRRFLPDAATGECAADASNHILVLRKDRKGREFNAIRVDRLHGMQKFREAELQPFVPDAGSRDGIGQYVEARLASDGGDWLLLDVAGLMQRVNAAAPFCTQEPGGSNSRSSS